MSRPLRRLRLASPRTLLRWHAQLVARRWTYLRRQPGRPPTAQPIRGLVLRMARENPTGGLPTHPGRADRSRPPGRHVNGVEDPQARRDRSVPQRSGPTWRQFLAAQAHAILAVDSAPAARLAAPPLTSGWWLCTAAAACTTPGSRPSHRCLGHPAGPQFTDGPWGPRRACDEAAESVDVDGVACAAIFAPTRHHGLDIGRAQGALVRPCWNLRCRARICSASSGAGPATATAGATSCTGSGRTGAGSTPSSRSQPTSCSDDAT
jgi:hypothetical protein